MGPDNSTIKVDAQNSDTLASLVSSLSTSTSSRSSAATSPATALFKAITWNIEGAKRNKFSLRYLVDKESPDFIFINECLLFQFEEVEAMEILSGEYNHALSSDDIFDPELPYIKNRSNGGTMILWRNNLNKFVKILPPKTPSFLGLLFSPPFCQPSLHISLYLPTSGKESEFISEITKLNDFIEDMLEQYPGCLIFIRGDSNVNKNNSMRLNILSEFKNNLNLIQVPIGHKTYHHFLGEGLFDSNIDVIIHSKADNIHEEVVAVLCQDDHPDINSHHDPIVSTFSLPNSIPTVAPDVSDIPTVANTRMRVWWSTENIPTYQRLACQSLSDIRNRWAVPSSRSCVSLLIKLTSEILNSAATSSNSSTSLSMKVAQKSARIPRSIKTSLNLAKRKLHFLKNLSPQNPGYALAKLKAKDAKIKLRKVVRNVNREKDTALDRRMFAILSSNNSSSIYRRIRSLKSSSTQEIPFLQVGNTVYHGKNVKAGFYNSISSLKSRSRGSNSTEDRRVMDYAADYEYILEICKNKRDIPNISMKASTDILKRMKSSVIDFSGITPAHYIYAGGAGLEHFNFLLNIVIEDVNNASIDELNECYALLLHKGHEKPRTKDSAYRTISTCPVLARALDLYIRDLHRAKWRISQAATQYQGEGSSHELAALLVTEVVQRSIYTLKEPAYLLFLDAKSAFDRVLPELMIRSLYVTGMDGNSTVFVANRLTNRKTFLEWEKNLMGPIKDEVGLEQGGSNSSEYYKIYSSENLTSAQKSEQGIDLGGSQIISAIGLADDTVLAANKLSSLANILYLVQSYCEKYGVTLSCEKTKLLRIFKCDEINLEQYNPIAIAGQEIKFCAKADHVGVLRSCTGNLPHLLGRICSHRKAMRMTLSSGSARKSRANPLVGLRLQSIYGTPVLLSGVASLVLSRAEIAMIDQHLKITHQNLQKLHPNTPRAVVYFLGGCLPGEAVIHLRMLTLFGMVARLRGDPLRIHAENVLITGKSSSKSWFWLIREICLQYGLPHPLAILNNPLSKLALNKLIKARVVDYWEVKLRGESSLLSSLEYFHPDYMNITKPHPIWATVGSNPHEITKAIQQARFLSGRYKSMSLSRHWSSNKEGYCLAPTCRNKLETTEHILIQCEAYIECKRRLYSLWLSTPSKVVLSLVLEALSSETNYLLQFIIDCSVLPSVILATQKYGKDVLGELFYLTRSWCFSIHRSRMKMLGRWNFQ